nr:hypothetical protein [Micromonospora sp. DSM 115978]
MRFEVGVLADEIFATVLEALMSDRPWRIGRTLYRRAGTDVTALATYPDLAAAATPSSSWGFRLVTPTGFGTAKEEGVRRQRVLPQPEWVFRSLFNRWHGLAGGITAPLPDSLPAAVEEHFEVADGSLRV